MNYLRSRSYNTNENFRQNARCNKIMGISCGDGGSSDTNNWQTLSPYYKWKEACSSAGQVFIKDRYFDVSYLCCNDKGDDKYDGKCTTGCRRDDFADQTCYDIY